MDGVERWMVDLDGTLTIFPNELGNLMCSLLSQGHDVQVLTGCEAEAVTPEIMQAKQDLLDSLNIGKPYTKLVVVANKKNHVAKQKVSYMRHVNATGLIDNDKHNIKRAAKAGFLTLRVKG